MGFSNECQILMENFYVVKGYGTEKLLKALTDKGWVSRGLTNF